MTEAPDLYDLNFAPDWYKEMLTEFYHKHAGKWGGPLQDMHYMVHDAMQSGWRNAGGWYDVDFRREELIDHPKHGEVAFLGAYMGSAWIMTQGGFETVPVGSLRRRADIPTEEKVISFEERRLAKLFKDPVS